MSKTNIQNLEDQFYTAYRKLEDVNYHSTVLEEVENYFDEATESQLKDAIKKLNDAVEAAEDAKESTYNPSIDGDDCDLDDNYTKI